MSPFKMKRKRDRLSSSPSESSSSSDSESRRRRSKSKKHSKKKSRKDKKSEKARKLSLISDEKKTTSNQAHEYNSLSLSEGSSTDEEEVELYRQLNKTAVASTSKSPNSSKISVKLQESPIRESPIAEMEKSIQNQLNDNNQQNESSIQYQLNTQSLVHYFIKQAANSSNITSMPTTSTSDANQQSIPTILISNKNSENDTPKAFRKKGDNMRDELIFPNKILMICQRKGCQFGVLHECRQLFSDIVSNAYQLRDGSGDIIDKVEVGKIARCKYCSFVVIHKLCQEKPDDTKNGMYTSVSSQTRVCADCKWRMVYTCNNDHNRNQCHWTKDKPNECTCGCIEVHHDCNLQSRKKT